MHPSNAQQAKFASRETPPPVLEDPALSRQSSRTGHESRISTPEGEKKKKGAQSRITWPEGGGGDGRSAGSPLR